jgi:hypothetical protein
LLPGSVIQDLIVKRGLTFLITMES